MSAAMARPTSVEGSATVKIQTGSGTRVNKGGAYLAVTAGRFATLPYFQTRAWLGSYHSCVTHRHDPCHWPKSRHHCVNGTGAIEHFVFPIAIGIANGHLVVTDLRYAVAGSC